jgi:hypothetical protein
MSGGIDSLCLLRANRLFYPAGHANSIQALVSVAQSAQPFPKNTITPEVVRYLEAYDMLHSDDPLHDEERLYLYGMIIKEMEKCGRDDLASMLKEILRNLGGRRSESRERQTAVRTTARASKEASQSAEDRSGQPE